MRKLYKVTQQEPVGWSSMFNDHKSIVGWEICGKELYLTNVKGIDLTVEGFIALCQSHLDDLKKACEGYERVCPYKVEKSYCWNRMCFKIKYLIRKGSFYQERVKDIIYLSCFEKLPNQLIFIPDLLLILDDLSKLFESCGVVEEIQAIKNPEEEGFIMPRMENFNN
jgi:hypothetical protein